MKRVIVLFCLLTVCSVVVLGGRYVYIRTKYPKILEKNDLKRIEFSAAYKMSKTEEDKKVAARYSAYWTEKTGNS
jgi:hypothetical protein